MLEYARFMGLFAVVPLMTWGVGCGSGSVPETGSETIEPRSPETPLAARVPEDDLSFDTTVTLASGQVGSWDIAVDVANVYWTNRGSSTIPGSVVKVPLGGGTPTTLTTSSGQPTGLAVNGSSVFWCDYHHNSSVHVVPIAGGADKKLASIGGAPTNLALSGKSVYVASSDGPISVPIGGGTPTTLTSASAFDVAVDSSSVYLSNTLQVGKVPIAGGAFTILASSVESRNVAIDATSMYWTDATANTIFKVGLSGGTVTTLVAALGSPGRLAIDGSTLYWSDYGLGTINKVPVGGGVPTTIATGQKHPWGITVDGAYVYWANYKSGSVKKAPK